jgi:Domain of unknown function (DUF4432)
MVALFGSVFSRAELRGRLGTPAAAAGVRLLSFEDGPERGVRLIEFRTGTGLRFTVLVDRCMDIGDLEWLGMPFGWQSATGYRSPALTDLESESGLGLLRSFSGFLVTCGFDHARRPEVDAGAHASSLLRSDTFHPLHGRGALTPARLIGYGADWSGDDLILWCEGEVRQAIVFGEHLVLRRRIEARAGTSRLTIADTIVNEGCEPVAHMLLYHINMGWPLLDEGAIFAAPIEETVWSSHAVEDQAYDCRTQPPPLAGASQQVFVHRVRSDSFGLVSAALLNPRLAAGVRVSWPKTQLPWLQQWQCASEGVYALGIEPVTNRFASRAELAKSGELIALAPGEARRYDLTIDVLHGSDANDAHASAVSQIQRPHEKPPRTGTTVP